MMRLTAFAADGQPLEQTRFAIIAQRRRLGRKDGGATEMMEDVRDAAPFAIRTQHGRGTLYPLHPLDTPAQYVLHVRATSFEHAPVAPVDRVFNNAQQHRYQTDFLVFVTISSYTF
jgi:hypothetical protein